MDANERKLIEWYRSLTTLERLALNHWLMTGDNHLLTALCVSSQNLQRFNYLPFAESLKQTFLDRR